MAGADYVIVLTTLPADADHPAFARKLVEARVAACVNVLPEMQSFYCWQGRIEEGRERQLLIKTTREAMPRLRERIQALHPYHVPEFIVVPILEGSESYLTWISASVS